MDQSEMNVDDAADDASGPPHRISRLLYWGNGASGQLGNGDVENVTLPSPLRSFDNRATVSLSSGFRHTIIAADEGLCYTCGSNDNGELGHRHRRTRPEVVDALDALRTVQVAAGQHHSATLTASGELYMWGASSRGQLGLGLHAMTSGAPADLPQPVRALRQSSIVQIAAGDEHMLALGADGEVWAWGDNGDGQLGIGTFAASHTPTKVAGLHGVPITRIACGSRHSVALSAGGDVYVWGSNRFGQLGLGDAPKKLRPILLDALDGKCAVEIACGGEHTAVITAAGRLITFGSGSNGQLGHGTDTHEVHPRTVVELMRDPVTLVACGRRHTLAYQPRTNVLTAFGLGASGQLGIGTTQSVSVPTPVRLPEGARVLQLFAGGDQSFVSVDVQVPAHIADSAPATVITLDPPLCRTRPDIGPRTLDYLSSPLISRLLTGPTPKLLDLLTSVFASASSLNASFFPANSPGVIASNFAQNGGEGAVGVDLPAVRDAYAALWAHPDSASIAASIGSATSRLVTALLEKKAYSLSRPDSLRFILILLENPMLLAPERMFSVLGKLATILAGLSGARRRIGEWLAAAGPAYLGRAVQVFQGLLSYALAHPDAGLDLAVPNCAQLLQWLHTISNACTPPLLPARAFYNPTIPQRVDIIADYETSCTSPSVFALARMPFLYEPVAKEILYHSAVQMRMQGLASAAAMAMLQGKAGVSPVLELRVRREALVEDAFRQVVEKTSNVEDLYKALIIRFQGEEAQDDGGVRKEFFHLFVKHIVDPAAGFFTYDPETRFLWFRSDSPHSANTWELLGILFGLAVSNSCLLDLQFPSFFYEKIFSAGEPPVALDDLAELEPSVYRSLKYIADLPETEEATLAGLGLTYEYDRSVNGQAVTVELRPGGASTPVTMQNRHDFTLAVARMFLVDSIAAQFRPLKRGFLRVCDGPPLRLFEAGELELLIRGMPSYHFHELEAVTRYGDGYTADHPNIVRFWQVFHSLPTELKQKFLVFVSGSDRVPLGGWKRLGLIIQRSGNPKALPAAHTCFNVLDLPDYPSLQVLQEKLVYAIQHTDGFGLV